MGIKNTFNLHNVIKTRFQLAPSLCVTHIIGMAIGPIVVVLAQWKACQLICTLVSFKRACFFAKDKGFSSLTGFSLSKVMQCVFLSTAFRV